LPAPDLLFLPRPYHPHRGRTLTCLAPCARRPARCHQGPGVCRQLQTPKPRVQQARCSSALCGGRPAPAAAPPRARRRLRRRPAPRPARRRRRPQRAWAPPPAGPARLGAPAPAPHPLARRAPRRPPSRAAGRAGAAPQARARCCCPPAPGGPWRLPRRRPRGSQEQQCAEDRGWVQAQPAMRCAPAARVGPTGRARRRQREGRGSLSATQCIPAPVLARYARGGLSRVLAALTKQHQVCNEAEQRYAPVMAARRGSETEPELSFSPVLQTPQLPLPSTSAGAAVRWYKPRLPSEFMSRAYLAGKPSS